jgi:hypothetical protein
MKKSAMRRILDVGTGAISERSASTQTLNVPPDFDPRETVLSVDTASLGYYTTKDGVHRSLFVRPSPLSRRSNGEKCLIACAEIDASGATCRRVYRLSRLDDKPGLA